MFYLSKIKLSVLLMVLMMGMTIPVYASQWEVLGVRNVKHGVDKDVMHVTVAEGGFRQIKIAVKKSPVNIKKLIVVYANGSRDELAIKTVIRAGGESRLIDLRGGKRVIKKIIFVYETIEKGRGKSVVTAWGRRGI